MCGLWKNGNKPSSDQWHHLLILTLLHHPGAAYCTQSSCQEHRRVPSLFSETSPSANNALLNTLWENSPHFLKWSDVVTWVSRDWQSTAPASEHWRRCRFSIITWPNRSLMFTWINRQSPFRFELKCAIFDKSWWKHSSEFSFLACISARHWTLIWEHK